MMGTVKSVKEGVATEWIFTKGEARYGGEIVAPRRGTLTPLAVTRKSITHIPRKSIKQAKHARKKRVKIPFVHKTITVSIIFPLIPSPKATGSPWEFFLSTNLIHTTGASKQA
jgi:hypothetical protein